MIIFHLLFQEEDANADTAAQNLSPNTNNSEDVVHAGVKRYISSILHNTQFNTNAVMCLLYLFLIITFCTLSEELQNQNHLLSQKLHPPRDYEAIRNEKIHMLQGCCGRAELHQVTSSNNVSQFILSKLEYAVMQWETTLVEKRYRCTSLLVMISSNNS